MNQNQICRNAQYHLDSGVIRFAPKFNQICREIISSGQTLDALILTHVDDDHIGGFLANFRNNSYQYPFNEVWMNYDGAGSTQSATSDANLSTRQNDEIVAGLKARNVPIRCMHAGDRILFHGAQIDVVCPEKLSLAQSSSVMRSDTPLARHSDYRLSLTKLAEAPIKMNDTICNNKNSIVFTFTYGSHRLLFAGDAWAEDEKTAEHNRYIRKYPHHVHPKTGHILVNPADIQFLCWIGEIAPSFLPPADSMLKKAADVRNGYETEIWHRAIDTHLLNQFRVNKTIAIDAWGLYQLLDTDNLDLITQFEHVYISHVSIMRLLDELSKTNNHRIRILM